MEGRLVSIFVLPLSRFLIVHTMVRVELVRILCLVALFVAILIDPAMLQWAGRAELQLVLATAAVVVLLAYDVIVGFILGIMLVVIYFRYHADKFGIAWADGTGSKALRSASTKVVMGKYITPEHLASAQDNVVDKKNAEMEIKGITGVYGEAVYGAQGTDTTMPGYTTARGLTGAGQAL